MKVFRIDCGYQNYDWGKIGSASAVAQFAAALNPATKIDETKPYAELWMGTHPLVPSHVVGTTQTLRDVVGAHPRETLHPAVIDKFGSAHELPFLFKVLLIAKVLLIQAHPDKALARQLHAADPQNYPDDNHKPEMAIAVTAFEGFCGFKPMEALAQTLQTVPELRRLVGEELADEFVAARGSRRLLQRVFALVMTAGDNVVAARADELVARATTDAALLAALDAGLPELIVRLNRQFPRDVGLFCGCLLLNHVRLDAGEAMFLQAKDPHAYILGDIIECMAASDNVIRAGFTPKFKDVDVLVDNLTYLCEPVEQQKMPLLPCDKARGDAAKLVLYDPPIAEFAVLQTIFDRAGAVQHHDAFAGPSIIICTKGAGKLAFEATEEFKTGYVYFVAPGAAIDLESSTADFTTYRAFVEA